MHPIHVKTEADEWDPTADIVMVDYYQTTCGWHSRVPHDGGDITRAVLEMIYENGYCNCP